MAAGDWRKLDEQVIGTNLSLRPASVRLDPEAIHDLLVQLEAKSRTVWHCKCSVWLELQRWLKQVRYCV